MPLQKSGKDDHVTNNTVEEPQTHNTDSDLIYNWYIALIAERQLYNYQDA